MKEKIVIVVTIFAILFLLSNPSNTFGVVTIDIVQTSFSINLSTSSESPGQTLTINNTGTQPISTIYVYTTVPSANPTASGISTNYDAGNFILFQNQTNNLFYANHLEFNETVPVYIRQPANVVSVGRFRFFNGDFFWALTAGSTNNCTNGSIYMSSKMHNSTSIGDADLTDNFVTFSVIDNGARGATDINAGTNGYCAIVESNCQKVTFVKWNQGNTPFDSGSVCNKDNYLFSGNIQPNQTVNFTIFEDVPRGVANGTLTQGTITAVASA